MTERQEEKTTRPTAIHGDAVGETGQPPTDMQRDPPYAGDDQPASFAYILGFFLRHRYLMAALCTVGVALGTGLALFGPTTYTSRVSFMPQAGGQSRSGIAGLADRFGLVMSLGDPSQTPQFYTDLLRSRAVLESVAAAKYALGDGAVDRNSPSTSLADVLGIAGGDESTRIRRASSRLRESIKTTIRTGVVEIAVTLQHPQLAAEVARRLVDELNEFNLKTRRSQASGERGFLEQRLEAVGDELRSSEEVMRRFLEQNRSFANSPELVFEHERLQRQVSLQQQIYTELARAYEQARIAEVRNTPVLTVVEEASTPTAPDSARLFLKAAAGLMLGILFGLLWSALRDFLSGVQRGESADYRELRELLGESSRDLRTVWRRVRR